MHEILGIGHHAVRLVGAPVFELGHDELGLVNANRHQRLRRAAMGMERWEHIADRDGVERRRDEHGPGRLDRVLSHRILRLGRIGHHAGQRSVIPNRPGQHEGNLAGYQGVHDSVGDDALRHRRLDRAGGPNPVDGPHVKAVAARGRLAGTGHAEGGTEDGGFDIVHRDGIADQHGVDVPVGNEPLEVGPGPRMHQGRSDDPDQVSAVPAFVFKPIGQLFVVDRTFPAHLGRHEPKLVGAGDPAKEPLAVHHDPLGSVFGQTDRHQLPSGDLPRLDRLQPRPPPHDHPIHPGPGRQDPIGPELHIRGQVGGREEVLRHDPVGRGRLEGGFGCPSKWGPGKIGEQAGHWRSPK